jgi:hypothetical protein
MIVKKTAPSDSPKAKRPNAHKSGSMSASHPKRPSAMKMRSVVKGQHRTHATQQIAGLFNHLVGGGQHRGRHVEAEYLCGFEIDNKLKCRRLLDWQVAEVCALEDPVHI